MKAAAALAIALATASGVPQTTSSNQVEHVETALNHFTVIDFGEPVTMCAIADRSNFDVDRRDNMVFVEPTKEGVATNLFVKTGSRSLVYEIDAAGEVSKMTVLISNPPPPPRHAANPTVSTGEPTDQEIQKIASLALTQALLGTENISIDDQRKRPGEVFVRLEAVFRAKDQIYIRYSVLNLSQAPFRITSPDVYEPSPTQIPVSILSLRDHQLSTQTFGTFKAKRGPNASVLQSELETHDLAPGKQTIGVISIRTSEANPPQLYQLDFGEEGDHPVTVEAVL